MKTNYRDLTQTLQDLEQTSNQILTLVGSNGQQLVRREWERLQAKSHQINTTILKVDSKRGAQSFSIRFSHPDRTTITKLYHRLVNVPQGK